MTYGLPVQRQRDPLILFAEKALGGSAAAASPGRFFVNIIPWLRYIPDWMPGAGFKRLGKEIMKDLVQLREEPYQDALRLIVCLSLSLISSEWTFFRIMEHRLYHSYLNLLKKSVTNLISILKIVTSSRQLNKSLEVRWKAPFLFLLGFLTARIYLAASDTTRSAVSTFILAILIHPDVQCKAQQEIDSVVGSDRLPDFSDIPHLTYLTAAIKESLRSVRSYYLSLTYNDQFQMESCIANGSSSFSKWGWWIHGLFHSKRLCYNVKHIVSIILMFKTFLGLSLPAFVKCDASWRTSFSESWNIRSRTLLERRCPEKRYQSRSGKYGYLWFWTQVRHQVISSPWSNEYMLLEFVQDHTLH